MDETMAWFGQASSDWKAGERFVPDPLSIGPCHAIAKWQQSMEKTVKSLVTALRAANVLAIRVESKHDVSRYITALLRLPRSEGNRTIQQRLKGLLDQNTRNGIKALESLAPRLPSRRNTEYPFLNAQGQWTYPAAMGEFSPEELQRFRELSHRILQEAGRIISALRRGPR